MDASGQGRADYRVSNPPSGQGDLEWSRARGRSRREPGLAGWQALLVFLVIAGIGGAVDVLSGNSVRGGFNVGLVVASIVGIVLVRRRHMLTIIVAPPLVYAIASIASLYFRSGGLNNRKVLLDAAVNWLVYGFPAMAAATGAVLLIAAVRLLRARWTRSSAASTVPPSTPGAGQYGADPYEGNRYEADHPYERPEPYGQPFEPWSGGPVPPYSQQPYPGRPDERMDPRARRQG